MRSFKVIATSVPQLEVATSVLSSSLGPGTVVDTYPLPGHISDAEEDSVVAALESADALLVRAGSLPGRVIERLTRLKIIVSHGSGTDQIDVRAATANGVWVTNVPGGNSQAVLEFTISAMINLLRQTPQAIWNLRVTKDWDGSRVLGQEIRGKVIGLVGFGNIGRGVAKVCQSLGGKVVACRKSIEYGECENVSLVPFKELLGIVDILSLHLPLTDETRGMMSGEAFERIRAGSFIVNASRGAIIDGLSLEKALASGHLAGAALDLLPTESAGLSSILFTLPNVIITPHMAGSTQESLERIATVAARDIALVLSGTPPVHAINVL